MNASKLPLPGFTFWGGLFLTAMLLSWFYISHLGDVKPVGYTPNKAVEEVYHFHKPTGHVTVVTPLEAKMAEHFGPRVHHYAQEIRAVNDDNSFPSNRLLMAIAATESSFHKEAESSSSVGLLQINYTAHGLQREDLFDVKTNVKHSISILQKLHKQCYGDFKCTVLSYNVGYRGYKEGKYNIAYYKKVVNYLNM